MTKIIDDFAFNNSDSGFLDANGKFWKASTLAKAVKDQKCKPYKLPIKHIDLTYERFGALRICDMAHHVKRCNKVDTAYPVIVGPMGNILDGWHRIIKAVSMDADFVYAVRLKEMPEPDEVDCDNES